MCFRVLQAVYNGSCMDICVAGGEQALPLTGTGKNWAPPFGGKISSPPLTCIHLAGSALGIMWVLALLDNVS